MDKKGKSEKGSTFAKAAADREKRKIKSPPRVKRGANLEF